MNTDRRSFLKYCGMVSLGISSSVIPGSQAAKKKKPNVILFMTDDQGWGDVGFNGNKEILTPNMDGLVKRGARLHHYDGAALFPLWDMVREYGALAA